MTHLQSPPSVVAEPSAGLLKFIADQRRFEWLIVAVMATTSVLKGFHSPESWTYTQAQMSYRFGFVRRGFLGAAFGDLLGLQHIRHFRLFSFAVLGIALGLVVLLLKRSRVFLVVPHANLPALLASSFALTFVVDLVGYLDVLLLALVTGFLLIRGQTARLVLLPVLVLVGILVHEEFLLLFVPVILLTFVLDAALAHSRRGVWIAVVGAVLSVALTVAVSHRTVSDAQVNAIEHFVLARADAPITPLFFSVLTTPLAGSVRLVFSFARQLAVWTHIILPILAMFVPVLSVLTYINVCLAKQLSRARLLPIVCAAAGLMPLGLSVLGTDTARWFADATVTSVLMLCALCMRTEMRSLVLSQAVRNLIVLLVVVNLVTGELLMGSGQINSYPYTELILHAVRGVLGHG